MKFTLPKDFCLWLVPSNDGKVRKVRFTFWRAVSCFALIVTMLAGFVFITSDYARVQLLSAQNILQLQRVQFQRDLLQDQRDTLDHKMKELHVANEKAMNFERNMKQRLGEMKSLIASAAELGLVPEGKQAASEDKDAIGGMESDCSTADCSESLTARKGDIASLVDPQRFVDTDELIGQLDTISELIQTLPLRLPTGGHITSLFGPRYSPFSRRKKMHHGIDFSTPIGSYVFSTADGTVKNVKRTKTYGLSVDVSHGKHLVTRYAHLSKALVRSGEKICAGEVVALAGSTGRSTGPHLHYEILVRGKAIDPSKVLALAPKIERVLR